MPLTNSELRDILAEELRALRLGTTPTDGDAKRIGLKLDISDRIIDSARLEVSLNAVLKGSIEVPFIENCADERPNSDDDKPPPPPRDPLTAVERTALALTQGPSAKHPWRKSERAAA